MTTHFWCKHTKSNQLGTKYADARDYGLQASKVCAAKLLHNVIEETMSSLFVAFTCQTGKR